MRITFSKIPRFLPKATVEGKAGLGLGILLSVLSDESRSISRSRRGSSSSANIGPKT